MNPGDILAGWITAQRGGRISQLAQSLAWFAGGEPRAAGNPRPWIWIREMSALGYLEADWRRGVWQAAPTCALSLPGPDALLYLTGGIGPAQRAAVDRLDDADVQAYPEPVERPPAGGIPMPPALYLLPGRPDRHRTVAALLADAGFAVMPQPARLLAQRLPSLTEPLQPAAGPPSGAELERFDPATVEEDTRRWQPTGWSTDLPAGLYRWRSHRLLHRWHNATGWWRTTRDQGIYLALPGRDDLRYRPDPGGAGSGELMAPKGAPLPAPQRRAAALCSGQAPTVSLTVERYRNVPHDVAVRIATSLDQDLRRC